MDYLPLGCFGKAPCDRGYLEYNTSLTSSRTLRTWIREGFKEARMTPEGEEPRQFREGNGRRFLLDIPDAGELLAGVIGPSTDMHPRENVLALFTHFSRRPYQKHYHLLPLALQQVWSALEDSRNHLLEVITKDDFEDYLLATRVPAPASPGEVNAEYLRMQKDSISRIFRPGNGASLSALRKNMTDVADRVRKAGNSSTLAVELPLSMDPLEALFETSFWVDLLNRQFFWKSFQPSIFLERKPTMGRNVVLLFGGGLPVDLYEPLMGAEGRRAALLNPSHGSNGDGEETSQHDGPGENVAGDPSFERILGEKFSR